MNKSRVELSISNFKLIGIPQQVDTKGYKFKAPCSFTFLGKEFKRVATIIQLGNFAQPFVNFWNQDGIKL